MKMKKLKSGKAVVKNEDTGEMMHCKSELEIEGIWNLCNIDFKSGVVRENCKTAITAPLNKGKGKGMTARTIEVLVF